MSQIWADSDAKKNFKNVFNRETLLALYDLADKGHFRILHGIIKSGKESNLCIGETKKGKYVAVKIYMIEASNFRKMQDYLLGDPRFKGIKKNKRSVVFNWCKKEFKNLKRAKNAEVDVPVPIVFKKNVLVMEFLGEDMHPAPRLKEVKLDNPEKGLSEILKSVKKLYNGEKLVHGDLSEYNIQIWRNRPYLIDFSQSVIKNHPNAQKMLERDVENILNYFEKKYEIKKDKKEILEQIREQASDN